MKTAITTETEIMPAPTITVLVRESDEGWSITAPGEEMSIHESIGSVERRLMTISLERPGVRIVPKWRCRSFVGRLSRDHFEAMR